jgi:hypothetical protein
MIAAFSIQNETRGLEVGVAATLPATTLKILIALITTTLASRLLAATLPARLTLATLTALTTLTTLTTLSLAVALRVIGIRSHNASSEKVASDSYELSVECRRARTAVASIFGMKKGLTPQNVGAMPCPDVLSKFRLPNSPRYSSSTQPPRR